MPRATDIVQKIKPYVLRWIQDSVVEGAPTPHALNSAHHTGELADSQATQFLKTDGSRTLIGNLGVSDTITIDGVDISAFKVAYDSHVGAPDVHHSQVHAITGTDHTVTGSAWDIIGLTATDTLGVLTPSANVGGAGSEAILKSTSIGGLTVRGLTVYNSAANPRLTIQGSIYSAYFEMDSNGDLWANIPGFDFLPVSASNKIGSASNTWNAAYLGNLYCPYLKTSSGYLYLQPGAGATMSVGSFYPSVTKNYSCGSSTYIWQTMYTESMVIAYDATNKTTLLSTSTGFLSIDPTGGEAYVDGDFYPNLDSTYTLGTTSKYWSAIYGDEIITPLVSRAGDITINPTGSLYLDAATLPNGTKSFNLGSSAAIWLNVWGYAIQAAYDASNYTTLATASAGHFSITPTGGTADITGHFYPFADSTYTLGTSSLYWDIIYGDEITSPLLNTASGNLTLQPAGDVVLDPVGNDVLPGTGYDINLGSLSTKYLTLHAAELWVETLVAQNTIATIGGRILVGPTTELTSDIAGITNILGNPGFETAGAGGADVFASWSEQAGTGTIVQSATNPHGGTYCALLTSGASVDTYVYQGFNVSPDTDREFRFWTRGDGTYAGQYRVRDQTHSADIIALTSTGVTGTTWTEVHVRYTVPSGCYNVIVYLWSPSTSGGAVAFDDTQDYLSSPIYVKHNQLASGDIVYMEADGKVEFMSIESAPGGSGPYSYDVKRDLDGTGANIWYAGDAVFSTGAAGDGFIDLYSYSGVTSGTTGPTIVGNVRNSATYNDWSEHWAIGNLDGLYGYGTDIYGVGLGKYGDDWVTIESTDGIQMYTDNAKSIHLQPDGDVFIGSDLGYPGSTYFAIFATGQTYNTETVGAGDMLIGDNSASKANILWDYSAGQLLFRGGQTTQLYLDTDGSLKAGGSTITLDSTGIAIEVDTDWAYSRSYNFKSGTKDLSNIYGIYSSTVYNSLLLRVNAMSTAEQSNITCLALGYGASTQTTVSLSAQNATYTTSIQVVSSSISTISLNANSTYVKGGLIVGDLVYDPGDDNLVVMGKGMFGGAITTSAPLDVTVPVHTSRDDDTEHVIIHNSADEDAGLRFGVDHANALCYIYSLDPTENWMTLCLNEGAGSPAMGRVCIGGDEAGALLHLETTTYGYSTTYNSMVGMLFHGGTAGSGNYTAGLSFAMGDSPQNEHMAGIAGVQETSDNNQIGIAFFTHPSGTGSDPLVEAMRIHYDGSVVIGGTASGSGMFRIIKDTTYNTEASYAIKIETHDTSPGAGLILGANNSAQQGYIQAYDPYTAWTGVELHLQPNGGYVRIGDTTSPTRPLEVAGVVYAGPSGSFITHDGTTSISLGNAGAAASIRRIYGASSEPYIRIVDQNNAYSSVGMRALSVGNTYGGTAAPTSGAIIEGNVGIGVTTVQAKLDVNGALALVDGMTAPSTVSGKALIYVDSADGDLKVKFGDGTTKVIAADT